MFSEKIFSQQFRKAFSIVLILGILVLIAPGDSWGKRLVKANGASLQCKVMPLGDSITVGKYSGSNTSPGVDSDDIGYRKDLHDLLEGGGYSVDFVGTNSNGITFPFDDPQHEGHNGWRDDEIAANIYNNGGANWLSQNPADVILLHIGTNSLNSDETDVENILNEIVEFENNTGSQVIVIVARIIDQVPNNSTVNSFNNNVENMVSLRPGFGTKLFMVDMEDAAGLNYSIWPSDPLGDMIDSLHPFASGYLKMANVWYSKYNEVLSIAAPNIAPSVSNPGPRKNAENDNVSLQIIASDGDGDSFDFTAYNLPPGLNIDSSGLISGKISNFAASSSPYSVRIIVSDGKTCGNASVSFNWTIDKVNENPVIIQPDDQINYSGDNISLQIIASDIDGDKLIYSAQGLPAGLSINQNGVISGIISHTAPEFSPYQVDVTVEEEGNPSAKDTKSFNWIVYDGNPIIVNPGNQLSKIGDSVSLIINANSPPGVKLSFTANNLPPNLVINKSSGEITGEIAAWAFLNNPYEVIVIVTTDSDPQLNSEAIFYWMIHKGEIYIPLVVK